MSTILPPGVSERDFSTAIDAFRKVVGDENVLTTPEEMERYRDPYSPSGANVNRASAAVAPGSVEEVQEVIRIANQTGVPLSVIATGNNRGYGAGAPRLAGAVVLDTGKRLNKVLEVNEKLGYAVVEPGVSYFDLYNYLRENNIGLWIDCADLGWGSVLGNAMERGGGYTPYGDHFGMHCGMEVVLPDGDVLRTGMGALPGSKTWNLFQYGYGPYLDGIFTQSNFGVVTKMGIQLMPAPPGARTHMITFDQLDDLAEVVEITSPLVMRRLFHNLPILRNIFLDGGVMSTRAEWYEGEGALPDSAVEEMKEALKLGYWNMYFTLYGPPEDTEPLAAKIWSFYEHIPGAKFYTTEDRDDRGSHVLHDRHRISTGTPSLEELALMDWIPNGGHLSIAPISTPDGAELLEQVHMLRDLAKSHGRDYCSLISLFGKAVIHVFLVLFDTTDEEDKSGALELSKQLVADAAARGDGEMRTHNALMDQVASTYSWNDGALLRFEEKIKDAIDPNGIIAPGKSGIWPERFRGQGL